jgi:4-amino-4-deoxy-L-arabinose transferase-like glycosyltransferase
VSRHCRLVNLLSVVLLVLALNAQMMCSVRVKSATYDEQEYVARGYAVLKTGDMRLRLRHPLLTNLISALPLLLVPQLQVPTEHGSWASADFHAFSAEFLWHTNQAYAGQIVYLSRWPMMLLTVFLAVLVYRWARALWSVGGGLLALVVMVFDPNIVAHGRLANTDIGATTFIFLAAYAFWEYRRCPTWSRLGLAGLACGLAQTTRFTAMLLFPIFGLEMLIETPWLTRDPAWPKLRRVAVTMLVLAVLALLTIWAVYGFAWGPVGGVGPSLPAPGHWGELRALLDRLGRADRAFLLGRIYEGGWWLYFPVALAVKTPLPTVFLVAWSGIAAVRERVFRRYLHLWLPVLAYLGFAVVSSLNTGYRLILPILPFLAVCAGRVASGRRLYAFERTPPARRYLIALGALLVWLLCGTVHIYPHYLAYFNELVGPRKGYQVLVDSNLDWGQDLPGLRQWMDEHGIDQVYLSWFGTAPPEQYGVRHRYLPGWPPFERPALRVYHPQRPLPGTYAISATNLQGVLLDDPSTFATFRSMLPVAQVGCSIFIYEVPSIGPPANLALGGARLDEIPAQWLDVHTGTNDLRLRWFDPRSSLVLMPARSGPCYVIADDHPLADALHERFLGTQGPVPVDTGSQAYPCPDPDVVDDQLTVVAVSTISVGSRIDLANAETSSGEEATYGTRSISFDHRFALLGYELLTPAVEPGASLELLTYWRVLDGSERPLAIFVHLIDSDGGIRGQYDGLDVAVERLYGGDVFVQLHAIAVPEQAPTRRYRLELGLYDPATMERLSLVSAGDEILGDRVRLSDVVVQ